MLVRLLQTAPWAEIDALFERVIVASMVFGAQRVRSDVLCWATSECLDKNFVVAFVVGPTGP